MNYNEKYLTIDEMERRVYVSSRYRPLFDEMVRRHNEHATLLETIHTLRDAVKCVLVDEDLLYSEDLERLEAALEASRRYDVREGES